MSDQPIYQIISQNEVELILQRTTLETATDVTYTNEQFCEIHSDSVWNRVDGYWYSYGSDDMNKIYYINKPELRRQVLQQLEKSKEAIVELSEEIMKHIQYYNDEFKPHGFMFRPSKGVFVKFKARPKKKVVSKALINDMRNMFMEAVCNHIQTKYGFHFKYVSCCNKKDQAAIVKFGLANGYTWNEVTTVAFQTWNEYDRDADEYVSKGRPLMAYLQHRLSSDPEMIQPTFDEFKKWYDESLK